MASGACFRADDSDGGMPDVVHAVTGRATWLARFEHRLVVGPQLELIKVAS